MGILVRSRGQVLGVMVVLTVLAACSDGGDGASGGAGGTSSATRDAGAGTVGEFGDRFNLIGMAHSSPSTPSGLPIEVETNPWDGSSTGGPYSYASAPCTADAPINNVSTNLTSLNTRLEGSRSPASTRLHPLEFEVLSVEEDGSGEMEGSVELVVCHPRFGVTPPGIADTERDRIMFEFTASFTQPTPEETTWVGEFQIQEASGVYAGMQGSGQIAGYLMCLGPERCGEGGPRDAQVAMIGSYEAPEEALQ